jgi:hypothetical protein
MGVIHNLGPSIHNLVHNFWRGNGTNGDLSTEIAIPTVRLLQSYHTTYVLTL